MTITKQDKQSAVYVTFLDASKALDRIDHCLLFDKMIQY